MRTSIYIKLCVEHLSFLGCHIHSSVYCSRKQSRAKNEIKRWEEIDGCVYVILKPQQQYEKNYILFSTVSFFSYTAIHLTLYLTDFYFAISVPPIVTVCISFFLFFFFIHLFEESTAAVSAKRVNHSDFRIGKFTLTLTRTQSNHSHVDI